LVRVYQQGDVSRIETRRTKGIVNMGKLWHSIEWLSLAQPEPNNCDHIEPRPIARINPKTNHRAGRTHTHFAASLCHVRRTRCIPSTAQRRPNARELFSRLCVRESRSQQSRQDVERHNS
jgi:hypothetical protein